MLQMKLENLLAEAYHAEVFIVQWTQQILAPLEPALLALSEYCAPAVLLNYLVPLVGAFNHQLLVRLVGALGVINVLASLYKWTLPAERPYWWIREYNESSNLQQYRLTCETTGGFPSSHCLAFTIFIYLLVLFVLPSCWRRLQLNVEYLKYICRGIVVSAAVCMALSRIYLAAQFPHQCAVSIVASIVLLHAFDKHSEFLYTLSRRQAVLIVLCFGVWPVLVYFGMQQLQMDPHWSVRMAFKWCADPSSLHHESSPIFVLCRDFGQLLGVVLSAPLYKSYDNKALPHRRLPLILILCALNFYARAVTPKQHGRFAFVAYEFVRNAMHSFTLLTIVPKFT